MKKSVKIVLIVLLVVTAIVTTCFFFYKNLDKQKDGEVSLLAFATNENKQELYNELSNNIIPLVNSDNTDDRFNQILITLNNLDKSYDVLTTYYLDEDFMVKKSMVGDAINSLSSSVDTSLEMISQYKIKADHTALDGKKYFDRHEGANDLYLSLANYITRYSNLITIINDGITGVNKNADVKFAVINVYAEVAMSTFSKENIELKASKQQVKSLVSLQWLNACYNINHLYLESSSAFSADCNYFTKYYNECNTKLFASKLNELISNVSADWNDNFSAEEKAAYYFKRVMR